MLARSPDPAASQAAACSRLPKPSRRSAEPPPKAAPEDAFEILRGFIEAGQIGKARELTREAVRRIPDHDRIRLAKRILNDGKAAPNPYVQPTAAAADWR